MENKNNSHDHLPPGFRFHPTDEELIMFYLRNQATSRPCPVSIIPEVDIYKFDPWQLPEKAEFGEKEWYFFSPRDRKYPNGVRPNRATVSGYWKATGTDKAIHSGSRNVGVKKALVFYKGRPPKGIKTDWIMHEYRLLLTDSTSQPNKPRHNGSMRLDDWVLCRIYKKKPMGRVLEEESFGATLHDQKNDMMGVTSNHQPDATIINNNNIPNFDEQNTLKFPRTYSLSHLLEMDYNLGSIKQFLNDNSTFDHFQNDFSNIGVVDHHNRGGNEKFQFVQEMMPSSYYQYADSVKYQVNQVGFSSLNSIYDFQ